MVDALPPVQVSIVVAVWNKLAFTRQCLDRLWRNSGASVPFEVIVVDNGSSDGTERYFRELPPKASLRYHRNGANLGFAKASNIGARLSTARYLLFLNNDTLVQPGWLDAMVESAQGDPAVGIVGIKQLFPYTSRVHHVGIVFTAGGVPLHLHPHADASLPHVNRQREYQAVNGACLLITRELFLACGGFDEGYRNGYEDVDLCLAVRRRGRKVVCCTRASIDHYGQISEGRTADDPANALRFAEKWRSELQIDEARYLGQDIGDMQRTASRDAAAVRGEPRDAVYLADDLSQGSALAWAVADIALALRRLGVPVFLRHGSVTETLPSPARRELEALMRSEPPRGGTHVKWSHYWPRHLSVPLAGELNLELFVINYSFSRPGSQPLDHWLQCLLQNHHHKLPLSRFCRDVLLQVGVREAECTVIPLGYSPEIDQIDPPARRRPGRFRFLTLTNSHDLTRYGTRQLLEAYWAAFGPGDDVELLVKDYGASAADDTLRRLLEGAAGRARVEYLPAFTSKRELIQLYSSSDAYVSAHRGEGYGQKILDAMACRLAVVTPLFGGPADFCHGLNSFPVAWSPGPLGDCLDSRSLRITNGPTWCEPDVRDLARQLRRVFEDRPAAAAVAERARADVIGRFTWENTARRLVEVRDRLAAQRPRPTSRPARAPADGHGSPYWLGCRVSVILSSFERREVLVESLRALEAQTILPEEFEVIVVADESKGDAQDAPASLGPSFPLRYHRGTHEDPAAARNSALGLAGGELVLFLASDLRADERLLEQHLLAHARHSGQAVAILGEECSPATGRDALRDRLDEQRIQALASVPQDAPLDHRFFDARNISLKRAFVMEAADAGVVFDPCFHGTPLGDAELAYRLLARGLEIRRCPEARAFRREPSDLNDLFAREREAGRMAVVFYRKHPQLDDSLRVRWVGELAAAAEALAPEDSQRARLRALDGATDRLLFGWARMLIAAAPPNATADPRSDLGRLLGLMRDLGRARGKVEEWFAGVTERSLLDDTLLLLSSARKARFLHGDENALGRLGARLLAMDGGFFDARVGTESLAAERGPTDGAARPGLLRRLVFRAGVFNRLRAADLFVQARLQRASSARWLGRYRACRDLLKRWL